VKKISNTARRQETDRFTDHKNSLKIRKKRKEARLIRLIMDLAMATCVVELCKQGRSTKEQALPLVEEIVKEWCAHCKAENFSRGNKARRRQSFFEELLHTFPEPPPK